jgi:hypothetical protein
MIGKPVALTVILALLISCGPRDDISEHEARKISSEYAIKTFPRANFSASSARPFDTQTAWIVSYYLPVEQYGGMVTVIVHKKTGEVMVAYSAGNPETVRHKTN